ncbi:hypothetical protein MPER_15136, partial [Moniliophthora perniciosa FA553]
MSGWTYSKELGANIQPEQKSSWDAWAVKNNPKHKFRNEGFRYYDEFDIIYPVATAIARNTGVCRGGRAESEEWDIERMEPRGSQDEGELLDSQKGDEGAPAAAEGDIIVGEDAGSEKDVVGVGEAARDKNTGVGDGNATSSTDSLTRKRAPSATPLPLSQDVKRTKSLDSISTPKPRLAPPQHVTPTQRIGQRTKVANALGRS